MGQNKFAVGLLIGCLWAGGIAEQAIANDNNPNVMYLANSAKLPLGAVKALRTIDMPVAIAEYIPADFFLQKVEMEFSDWGGVTYRLIYNGVDEQTFAKTCFAIEGTNDGIGSLPTGNASYPFVSLALGIRSTVEAGYYGDSEKSTYLGNWIGLGEGHYRFVGAGVYKAMGDCNNVSIDEAIAISESLQYLP